MQRIGIDGKGGPRGALADRLVLLAAVVAVVAAACAPSDQQIESSPTVETGAPTETAAPVESGAPTETAAPVESGAPTETAAPVESGAPTETAAPVESGAPTETAAPVESGAPTEAADRASAYLAFRECILGTNLSQESIEQVLNNGPLSLSSSQGLDMAQGCVDSSDLAQFIDAEGALAPDTERIARRNAEILAFDACMTERGWPPQEFAYNDIGRLVPADEDDHGYIIPEGGREGFSRDAGACERESGQTE